MKKYSVLTFLMNDYDIVREPLEISEECEYVLVTDNKTLKSDTWTIKYIPDELMTKDGFTKSFYVRYHPFEFVTTDICIVLDASIRINKSLDKIIDDFLTSKKDICLSVHWNMINAWPEYVYWVNYRNYSRAQAERGMSFMRAIGYTPEYKGCFEATFKIQKNNAINNEINDCVWRALMMLGNNKYADRVDQSILSAIMNTLYEDTAVFPITRTLYQSTYMTCFEHHSTTPLTVNILKKDYFLFNKKCELYEIHDN